MILTNLLTLLLEEVISGKRPSVEIPFIPAIHNVGEILKEKGFHDLDFSDSDMNGYQIDFWYYFTHDKLGRYCLSGSLVYGGVVFRKEPDEDDE